jgi:pyridinium-3,5-biscarboxylic acid mononucleotide synthase
MQKELLKELLEAVQKGSVEIDEALSRMGTLSFDALGFARLDVHRSVRMGFPEVIFCPGKSPEHVRDIALVLSEKNSTVMATRADIEHYKAVAETDLDIQWYESSRIILVGSKRDVINDDTILVVSAGTADLPVAEEAAVTAEIMGNRIDRLYDVGVAGIHRLMNDIHRVREASVLVVVAGMDGALPSVIGGLVSVPVIAVPTSIGYGAGSGGLAPLLTMLNSCAPGVTVVNIDNGFGAGYAASQINRRSQ